VSGIPAAAGAGGGAMRQSSFLKVIQPEQRLRYRHQSQCGRILAYWARPIGGAGALVLRARW